MKRFFTIIVRISIINFFLFVVAVGIMEKFNESPSAKIILKAESSIALPTESISLPEPTNNLFSELQNHNTRSDCRIEYSGNIYDITSFFGSHPGGDDVMLAYCGQDATSAYDGVPHSANAKILLQQYLVQ